MPCATVHLLTAGRTLDAWRGDPTSAPFDPHDGALVRDFLSGAMSPDMGFVAGVDRTISELVHYVRTGCAVRSLLGAARTPGERAFAWGWGTHHLTDVLIHPLVGKAVGQILYGDRDRRVNASENEEIHVSVEVGLDILVQDSYDGIPEPSGGVLEGGRIDFLATAMRDTYGIPVDTHRLASDFRVASRQIQEWPRIIRTVGRTWGLVGRRSRPAAGSVILSAIRRVLPRESAGRGLSRPQRPPDWLPEEVGRIADEFPDRFQEAVTSDGDGFENRNLETGELETETRDHPKSEARLQWWRGVLNRR